MKLVKIAGGMYQLSITFANQVYSILTNDDDWCRDGWELKNQLLAGTYIN
ncbi:TPA: hypothetical protein ACMDXH_000742 [Vibrio parahaemolyticus]|nr:hypothetical protein [Vibrio vulnificus]EHY8549095.1 hypothetical protein [Vibrio parahaemolyticus]EHY8553046.1 hypothetical protein [Vibrio parahaemolyticus]EIA9327225.1 hypothetical protein [Vibrio parahaemolyticus]EJV9414068.1 hypothetical protein [Vibrio vulnificus]WNJ72081.1 hypothetical protein RI132_20315 [Vibrio vulnificus]